MSTTRPSGLLQPKFHTNINQTNHMPRLRQIREEAEVSSPTRRRRRLDDDETNIDIQITGRIRRQKTVSWKEAESIRPKAGGVESVTPDTEAAVVADLGGYYYEINKLELTLSSLSRFITYDGSDGPLPKQLWQAIDSTRQRLADTKNTGFLPNDDLIRIMNQTTTIGVLRKVDQSFKKRVQFWDKGPQRTVEEEARIICDNAIPGMVFRTQSSTPRKKSFRKILAILILIERPGAIGKFIDEGVCDSDLPLRKVLQPDNHRAFTLSRKDAFGGPDVHVKCMNRWRRSTIKDFERRQWIFLAPYFSNGEYGEALHYVLENEVILPFVYEVQERKGEHADIFKVRLHPEHHNFNEDEETGEFFAVKSLSGKKDFSQEVRMLKRLSNNSEHIVTLLATYEHCGKFHLIFPWADCDLETYWRVKNPSPTHDQETVLWMAFQCEGLAVGLDSVHHHLTNTGSSILTGKSGVKGDPTNQRSPTTRGALQKPHPLHLVFGRHGDIKPANLLWFSDQRDSNGKGVIKISDFGTGEFNLTDASSLSSSVPYTPPYRPPECDFPDPEINSSYDVWTLACLYLEFIIWYIGGWKLLKEFRRERRRGDEGVSRSNTFFMLIRGAGTDRQPLRAQIKPKVLEFMDRLEDDPACSEFLRWFLRLIRESMLLVDPVDRKSCRFVFLELGKQLEKCENNRHYAVG